MYTCGPSQSTVQPERLLSGKKFLALTVGITLLLQLLQQGYYNIFDPNGVVNFFFFWNTPIKYRYLTDITEISVVRYHVERVPLDGGIIY